MRKYINFAFVVFSLLASSVVKAQQPLNQINILNFSVKKQLPGTPDSWQSIPGACVLVAQRMPGVILHGAKLVVQIKQGSSKICGSTPQSSLLLDSFTVRNFNSADLTGYLSQCTKLAAGNYSLCVQFFNADNYPISREACKDFMVEDQAPQNYNPPQIIAPVNEKVFTKAEAVLPITFRWTPVVPKPKDPVTYKLRVWQLMQGQNGTQAMRSNEPIIEKEITNVTQAVVANMLTGPCKPPYLCDFVWAVSASFKDGKPAGSNNGMSQVYAFKMENTEGASAPENILPADKKVFTEEELRSAVAFRWTPVIPRPKEDVVYKLRVWQLMQGQNGTQAMRTNKPLLEKDVLDITETAVSGILTGPCKPPYLCDFVWNVQVTSKEGNIIASDPFYFSSKGATSLITNQLPEDNTAFNQEQLAGAINFRWTPVIPRPKEDIVYKLRVWQLMQGQNGIQAMRTNKPLLEKDVLDITEASVSGILTGPCKPPYLCDFVWNVQITGKEGNTIISEPFSFSVKNAATSSVTNLSPEDNAAFTQEQFKSAVAFRWTPVVPKPQVPVTYKLRVWQLMQGQNATQAMRTNKPLLEKDCLDITETAISGILTGPCKPPYLCDFVWNVKATKVSPMGDVEFLGESSASRYTVTAPSVTAACCPGTWGSIQTGTSASSLTTTLSPGFGLLPSMPAGSTFFINTCYTCGGSCGTPSISYGLYNGLTNAPIGPIVSGGNCVTTAFTFPVSLTPGGSYVFKIFANCGGMICDSSAYQFSPSTANCCTGGSWGTKKWGFAASTVNTLLPFGSIAAGCNPNIYFNVNYTCGSSCAATIGYKFYNSSSAVIATFSFPPGLTPAIPIPAGSTYFKVFAQCGGQICDSILNKITVTPPCAGSSWGPKTYMPAPLPALPWQTLPCSATLLPMHAASITRFRATYNCSCGVSQIQYVVSGPGGYSWTSPMVASGTIVNAPMPPLTGAGRVTINAYCNGVLCATCIDKLVIVP